MAIYCRGNNERYLRLHVKCSILLLIFSTDFHRSPQCQFHGNPSSRSRADTCGQTDGRNVVGEWGFSRLCERAESVLSRDDAHAYFTFPFGVLFILHEYPHENVTTA